jgi:hypothetical protein
LIATCQVYSSIVVDLVVIRGITPGLSPGYETGVFQTPAAHARLRQMRCWSSPKKKRKKNQTNQKKIQKIERKSLGRLV